MVIQKNANPTNTIIKPSHRTAKKNSNRTNAKEKDIQESKKVLAKTRKALKAAQAQAKHERQARVKVEKTLAEVRQSLAKEKQAQVKRVSFVVRLEVDKQGQPKRTEIEETQSRVKQNYPGLDGELLVAFMKVYINPMIRPEHAISAAPPAVPLAEIQPPTPMAIIKSREVLSASVSSANVQNSTEVSAASQTPAPSGKRRRTGKGAWHSRRWRTEPTAKQVTATVDELSNHHSLMPRLPGLKANLIVSNVQVRRLIAADFSTMPLTPDEPFIVQASFQLLVPKARSLVAWQSSCEMMVYAKEITGGRAMLLTTYSTELVQDQLEYIAQAEVPGLSRGLYRLFVVISLRAPIKIGGQIETFIWVI